MREEKERTYHRIAGTLSIFAATHGSPRLMAVIPSPNPPLTTVEENHARCKLITSRRRGIPRILRTPNQPPTQPHPTQAGAMPLGLEVTRSQTYKTTQRKHQSSARSNGGAKWYRRHQLDRNADALIALVQGHQTDSSGGVSPRNLRPGSERTAAPALSLRNIALSQIRGT